MNINSTQGFTCTSITAASLLIERSLISLMGLPGGTELALTGL